jgi:hypothetical protein
MFKLPKPKGLISQDTVFIFSIRMSYLPACRNIFRESHATELSLVVMSILLNKEGRESCAAVSK